MATGKKKVMKVVVKEPGKDPKIIELENELTPMQKLVGGYIQIVPLHGAKPFPQVDLVCDEEGKFKGYPVNFTLPWGDPVVGTVFFMRRNGGSLSQGHIDQLMGLLK